MEVWGLKFMLPLLVLLCSLGLVTPIPVLYPVAGDGLTLLQDLGSGEILLTAGAFSKFLCSDDSSIAADFPLQGCADLADKLIVRTSDSSIQLAFNNVDAAGAPLELDGGIQPQVNVTEDVAAVGKLTSSVDLIEFSIDIVEPNTPIEVSIDHLGEVRSLIVLSTSTVPIVSVKSTSAGLREDPPYAEFLVEFSEPVVPFATCATDIPRLTSPETVPTLLSASSQCAQNLATASFDDVYTVDLAEQTESSYDSQKRILTIRAYPDPTPVTSSERVLISFEIKSDTIMDYAGHRVAYRGSSIIGYRPPVIGDASTQPPELPEPTPAPAEVPVKPMNDTKTAEEVGKVTSAVVVATTVSTLGGSIVAAATTSATIASGAAGGAGSAGAAATGSASLGGILSILNMGQKIYLTSRLAVDIVPENYQAFASQMQWTMFDIRGPWENKEEKHEGDSPPSGRGQRSRSLKGLAPNFYQGNDQYDVLKRVLFWVGLLHLVLLVLHAMVVGFFRVKHLKVPNILYFPRLEIYTAYWTMPAIATACAGMFQGDADSKIIGGVVLLLLPGSFLVMHIVVIYLYFLRKNPVEWEARVILNLSAMSSQSMCQDDFASMLSPSRNLESVYVPSRRLNPPNDSSEDDATIPEEVVSSSGDAGNRKQPKGSRRGLFHSIAGTILMWIDKILFWLWLGPPMVNGEWKTKSSNAGFLARFGPMFEQCRGAGVVMTRPPTFALDPVTGKVDRGMYQAVMEPVPGLNYCSFVRLHHLQVMTTAANYVKLIIFAVVIGAEENDESFSQLVFLLLVATAFTLFLRVSRPYMARIELALAMLAESADIVTFVLGLSLILGPVSNPMFRKHIGLGMLWTEGLALGVTVFEKLMEALIKIHEKVSILVEKKKFEKSKGAELASVLQSVLRTHPVYLGRKFGHRWMVRALGRGLAGRMLVGEEVKFARKSKQYMADV